VSDQSEIPVLTDLIEKGVEIKISDLGLDDDLVIDVSAPGLGAIDPFRDNPALESAIQNILDKHMKLAWKEIRLAIQRELNKAES
jgi:hypothetical protein